MLCFCQSFNKEATCALTSFALNMTHIAQARLTNNNLRMKLGHA